MNLLQSYFQKTKEQQRKSATIAILAMLDHLQETSPSISLEIIRELKEQRRNLKMIASENYSSLSVQIAMGNWLTDKYAEGCPNHRFYAGCEQIDALETAACESLKALFKAEHAYVQPHSGADANLVGFWSIITKRVQSKEVEKIGRKSIDECTLEEFEVIRQAMVNQPILGLSLNSGGHLTHGYRHNVSSKFFQSHFYEVNPNTHLIDYDEIRKKAHEIQPLILLAGYSAYPRKLNFRIMREIADEVGATLMVDMAHFSGLVAGNVLQGDENPISFGHVITSTTHKTLRGPRGGFVLSTAEFKEVVNRGCPLVLGGPLPHVIAAKAIAFEEARRPDFQDYARQIVLNAQALAEALIAKGIKLLTNGTDNHMVIVDLSQFKITGRHAESALREVGINVNRNAIPFDTQGPWYTSGIRIGTPAITTLGMKETEMQLIADLIVQALTHIKPEYTATGVISKTRYSIEDSVKHRITKRVQELLLSFPLYPELPHIEISREESSIHLS
ncbi:MAG: glycine hydroxymethyltransferase [Chlamydia sp.]